MSVDSNEDGIGVSLYLIQGTMFAIFMITIIVLSLLELKWKAHWRVFFYERLKEVMTGGISDG